ncbi:MAG: hydroxymethylbilane synthase [Phycisphaerales bacterium]|jgi:hydroxymethylbilane synthase|nr:hydroxymethylbilane synthase [Phycisphaerales bacterium]
MLAMTQTGHVAAAIRAANKNVTTELVEIVTTGDETVGPLLDVGGKGLFTEQLEEALRDGSIDMAVHSAKDVPTYLDDDLEISIVPARSDPRDALVTSAGLDLRELSGNATVGTGSLRRRAQIKAWRSDVDVVPIRGNIETRLKRSLPGSDRKLDAVVLAMAGLIRSGLAETHAMNIRPLVDIMPAAGQGALAIETVVGNKDIASILAPINDQDSFEALHAERSVLANLEADCHSCIAVHFSRLEGKWMGAAMVSREDGSGMIKEIEMTSGQAMGLADTLSARLRSKGAMELLHG